MMSRPLRVSARMYVSWIYQRPGRDSGETVTGGATGAGDAASVSASGSFAGTKNAS